MKSKTSCFNKTIFNKNFTHFWPIWLIVMGWNLFILPFMIYNNSLQYKMMTGLTEKELAAMKETDIISAVSIYISPVVLFAFSVIAAMAVFSYLYNSRSANTIHALPVTRKELFITNYLSGLLFLLVPEFVGFLTGTLVSAGCGYTSMNYLLQGFLFACGISFFFYTFAVFIGMFTGQLFAIPVFALIINFLYVGYKFIFVNLVAQISYGLSGDYNNSALDVLSPLFYMSRKVTTNIDYQGEYPVCNGISGANVVIGYALCAVVLIVFAYLIYKSRNMETAGNLIAISWIGPFFRWGVALCGGTLFGAIFSSIFNIRGATQVFIMLALSTLIFGAVFFFAAQMFLEKGFRVFTKKRMIECGAFVAVFFVVLIGIECNWFGQESKLPDTDKIESAYINCAYPVGGKDTQLIEEIKDIHKQIIDSKKKFESYAAANEDVSWVNIKYYLKDGSVLRRTYTIPATDDMLKDPESAYGKVAEMMSDPDAYLKNVFGFNYDQMTIDEGYIDGTRGSTDEYWRYDLSKENTEKLYQAFVADLKAGNYKEYLLSNMSTGTDYQDITYVNTINIDYSCIKGIINMYNLYSRDSYPEPYNTDSTACISFDKNCKNIISTLIELGVIESEDDLVTVTDQNSDAEGTVDAND